MKITIYELLGMVKDGKAPMKIKYEDEIYELTSNENDYYNKNYGYWFTNQICSLGALNDTVEILEEKKIPEKIRLYYSVSNDVKDEIIFDTFCNIIQNQRTQEDKINEIIDYLKSKGDE